ncbi:MULTISPECIES: hypothetical protein [Escherichia]|nr:hypothetical protein [Escherichia sp. MOD1-EC5449]MED9011932.1 hypothetical protein [Escherichia marmotae]MED9636999.1 hypothetical protein [Escherichia marmotae]
MERASRMPSSYLYD